MSVGHGVVFAKVLVDGRAVSGHDEVVQMAMQKP
jgi:hypothetical protein